MRPYFVLAALAGLAIPGVSQAGMQLGAEVMSFDSRASLAGGDLNTNGDLVGATLRMDVGSSPWVQLEARALVGEPKTEFQAQSNTDTATLGEGRLLLGGAMFGDVIGYFGGGIRQVRTKPNGGERISSNIYVPLGLTGENEIPRSAWSIRSEVEFGFVVFGQEQISDLGPVTSETFTRTGGSELRATVEFHRGPIFLGLFARWYDFESTKTKQVGGTPVAVGGMRDETFGMQLGLGF